jgi:hypothetical protein
MSEMEGLKISKFQCLCETVGSHEYIYIYIYIYIGSGVSLLLSMLQVPTMHKLGIQEFQPILIGH